MNEFNCRLDIPEVPGLKTAEITVGREFMVTCTGPWEGFRVQENLQFELPPTETRAIKLLEAEALSADTVQLKVTSYRVGDWTLKDLKITDGTQSVVLGELSFQVQSVMDPLEPRQEPYGFLGPLGIAIPLSWWASFGVFLFVILVTAILQIQKRWQRRRILDSLRRHDSSQSPLAEFHQTLRRLKRDSAIFSGQQGVASEAAVVVSDIEKAFRLFLLRQFRLPAFDWSDGALLRALRKENRTLADDTFLKSKKLLAEFAAARAAKTVDSRDAVQLSVQSRRLVEEFEKAGRANS